MTDLQTHFHTCLFHASAALGRSLMRMAEEHFERAGLTPTMAFILLATKQAQGISLAELAMVHRLDRSTISRAVDKLSKEGFVDQEMEGRETRVFITPKGTKKAADAMAAWRKLQLNYDLILGRGEAGSLAERIAHADDALRTDRRGGVDAG